MNRDERRGYDALYGMIESALDDVYDDEEDLIYRCGYVKNKLQVCVIDDSTNDSLGLYRIEVTPL